MKNITKISLFLFLLGLSMSGVVYWAEASSLVNNLIPSVWADDDKEDEDKEDKEDKDKDEDEDEDEDEDKDKEDEDKEDKDEDEDDEKIETTVRYEVRPQVQQVMVVPSEYTTDTDGDKLVDAIDPDPNVPQQEYFMDNDADGVANVFDMHPGEDDFAYYDGDEDANGDGVIDSYEAI